MLEFDDDQVAQMDQLGLADSLYTDIQNIAQEQGQQELLDKLHQDETGQLLDQVAADAKQYGFDKDKTLLLQYAIFTVGTRKTPIQIEKFREYAATRESVPIALKDQFSLIKAMWQEGR